MERTFFAQISKNLGRYRSENNFVGNSSLMSNAAKSFDILTIILSVLHNYFDGSNKITFRSMSS